MVEVKVKVKVNVSKGQKKTRKSRKDKGTKRGKRTTKNPQFQTGSIDFRTIGTHATSNPTLLAGLIASRAVVPQYLQPQQPQTSTELTTYAPRDLPKNIPPPQFRADTEQAQEEVSTQVRKAMGERIGRLRKEEASLFLKGKGMEAKNMKLGEELRQKQHELIEQEGFVNKQKQDLIKGSNYLQKPGLEKILREQGEELTGSEDLTDMRMAYLRNQGLTFNKDFTISTRVGARGKASKEFDIVPIVKQDIQRAQEEVPEAEERFNESEEEPMRKPKPYKAPFIPNEEFISKIQHEMGSEEERQMSEIEKALMIQKKIEKKNMLEELSKTAVSLDSKLGQRLKEREERLKPRVAVR